MAPRGVRNEGSQAGPALSVISVYSFRCPGEGRADTEMGTWRRGGFGGKSPENWNLPKRLRLLQLVGKGLGKGLILLFPPPDVTLSPWSGDSKCHQRRVLTYTIPISNPLGPKSASVVETQVGQAGWPAGWGGRLGGWP